MTTRRSFLAGLFAAPAIIAVDRLMPVRTIIKPVPGILPYKGRQAFDTAAFYCPYIPLQLAGPGVAPRNGGLITRYDIVLFRQPVSDHENCLALQVS